MAPEKIVVHEYSNYSTAELYAEVDRIEAEAVMMSKPRVYPPVPKRQQRIMSFLRSIVH